MDLKGAQLRQFFRLTDVINTNEENTNRVLKVPHYQRPYKWGENPDDPENKVAELIRDWEKECPVGSKERYFAGALVTVADPKGAEHQLIDGQQRITTIFLLNYIIFLLSREAIAIGLKAKKTAVTSLYDTLVQSAKYLFTDSSQSYFTITKTNIEQALDSDDPNDLENFILQYCNLLAVSLVFDNEDDRLKDNYTKMHSLLGAISLRLQYSRSLHNDALRQALSKISINADLSTNPTIGVHESSQVPADSLEKTYLNSIDIIFNSFKNLTSKNTTGSGFEFCKKMISILNQFLENIELAVVQTGSPDDAYTLFEVLNDRSLALDDLDLLKNAFYKNFCDQSQLAPPQIDVVINDREDQWGRIFGNNTNSNKTHISYLASCYLTKKHDSNKTDKLRKLINTEYLKKYSPKSYNHIEFEKDFNIIETVKTIASSSFSFRANKLNEAAIAAELSSNTITYKTVHLLLALNLSGVLAGFINFILRYIEDSNSNFDPNKSKIVLDEIVSGKDQSGKDVYKKHSLVHEQATALWKCVMLNETYVEPLKLASNMVAAFHRNSKNSLNVLHGSGSTTSLTSWLNAWKYGKSANADLKLKILFIKLLSIDIDKSTKKLIKGSISKSIANRDSIHLDHLEPQNPGNNSDHYNVGKISRDDDVNALGNMFPLFAKLNSKKLNSPLDEIFGILTKEDKLLDKNHHWFTEETYDLLHKKSNHTISPNNHTVPNKSFFDERRSKIIDRIDEVINLI